MDEDYRDLANRLFATATAMLEDAIETAVAGQSSQRNPSELSDHGRQLRMIAKEIAVIAEAAEIVAELSADEPPVR